MQSNGSVAALQLIREYPEIKLVRSRRNLLDVMISRHKHSFADVNAHCGVDQVKCQEKHLTASKGMILPTKSLFSTLKVLNDHEDEVDHMLQEMGVPHIQVSYERMYHSDTADEWKRRMEAYLGILWSRADRHKPDVKVQEAMTHADTSYPWHNMTLGNYEEVKNVLAGTEFERLLL